MPMLCQGVPMVLPAPAQEMQLASMSTNFLTIRYG